MSVIQYAVNGAGIKCAHHLDPQDVDESTDDWEFEMMAQDAAEDYWDNHDGWESRWPLDIELFVDGGSAGVFEVAMEMEPTFSASKKKGRAA
ncbi:hypothetical protein [Klebsiella oxytoca]|uniref:hypothetical protein n=1 Tax=Klebsiella oxytoca TaxID=571 RepID=UPI003983D77C